MDSDLVVRVAGDGDIGALASLRLAWTAGDRPGRTAGDRPGQTAGDRPGQTAGDHPGQTDPASDHPTDADFERHLAAWIATEGDRRTIWLAEIAGEPVGMASLYEYRRMPRPGRPDSRWGYVGNMFVREDRRNEGIGTALLSALIQAGQDRGYARLTVSPTARSVPFYRRAGFVDADGAAGDRLLIRPGHLA
jgi:GNAT superfamily N-acetyltransferase